MTEPSDTDGWSAFRWIVGLVIGLGLVGLVMLQVLDLVDFSDTEATSKVIVAVVALSGVLFSATLATVGGFVNVSVTRQNHKRLELEAARNLALKEDAEKRLRLEGERNAQLQKEAGERLKLESAIKAMELFQGGSADVSAAEKAGAVFALTQLTQHGFALRLLTSLWPNDEIDSPSAVWVIEECLKSATNSSDQILAARLLYQNASRLVDEFDIHFPIVRDESWSDLRVPTRAHILAARLVILGAKMPNQWSQERWTSHMLHLYSVVKFDSDEPIVRAAAFAIDRLLPFAPVGRVVTSAGEVIELGTIAKDVEQAKEGNRLYHKHAELLAKIPDVG